MTHGRENVVGVPDAGVHGLRAGAKRARRARGADPGLLQGSARPQLAADFDAGLLAPGSHRFVSEEPRGPFIWLFANRDGSVSEYPTELAAYERFRALYGVPQGRWRP